VPGNGIRSMTSNSPTSSTYDPDEVWHRVDAEPGDLSDVVYAAERVATVDGDLNTHEKAVIAELRDRCQRR
jgi:tellurite resistance protein